MRWKYEGRGFHKGTFRRANAMLIWEFRKAKAMLIWEFRKAITMLIREFSQNDRHGHKYERSFRKAIAMV